VLLRFGQIPVHELSGAKQVLHPRLAVSSRNTPGIGYVEYDSFGTGCPGVGVWTYNLF